MSNRKTILIRLINDTLELVGQETYHPANLDAMAEEDLHALWLKVRELIADRLPRKLTEEERNENRTVETDSKIKELRDLQDIAIDSWKKKVD
jgi:hypothetical protein